MATTANLGKVEIDTAGGMKSVRAQKNNGNLYFAAGSAYLCALSFGYMIGYSSPALPAMRKEGVMPDESSASWFGSLGTIGALIGSFIGGWIVEKYGRKMTMLATSVPFLGGWGLICIMSDVPMLYLGRLLTGIGSGMVVVSCPTYIAEISTKDMRGMLGSGVQLMITVGILLVYLLGMSFGWRTLSAIGFLIPIAAVVITLKTPDSPRFYLIQNRKQEAIRALGWLRGAWADIEDEVRDIEESLDPDEKMSFSEFKKPQLFKPLIVSAGLMFFQQFMGINAVMFYTVSIFESAGFKENASSASVIIGFVQVIFTLAACFLMDRAGRRLLLLSTGLGMMITCITMGYYYRTIQNQATLATPASDMSWLALASLVFYIIFFSLGWGPIPMLVMSEIFPVRARGSASAISSGTSWISGFLITKEFSALQASLGPDGAFWFFAFFCFLSVIFVFKKVPETKGKSLEDIELYFLGRAIRGI